MPMLMPGLLTGVTVDSSSTDERLFGECLKGNEEAWNAVIDKYRALIYSVPIKQGLPPDGATDVFQEVVCHCCRVCPKSVNRTRWPPG